jgi:hypothetical protein
VVDDAAAGGKPPAVRRPAKKERAMNWDQIEGKWQQFRGDVRAKWGKLTDDDLETIKGKKVN